MRDRQARAATFLPHASRIVDRRRVYLGKRDKPIDTLERSLSQKTLSELFAVRWRVECHVAKSGFLRLVFLTCRRRRHKLANVSQKDGFWNMSRWRPDRPWNDLPKLPPKVELESKIVLKRCVTSRAALAELKQAAELIPNPAMLINTLPILEALHQRKTGALFRAALRIGGLIGSQQATQGNAAARLSALDRYAACLGLAFQISYDLIDVEGDARHTGKGVQKDAERGKLTYPGLLGIRESRQRLADICREAEEQLAPLGDAGRYLAALIQYVKDRDR